MKKLIIIFVLLIPTIVKADVEWNVYISTSPPSFPTAEEIKISSYSAVDIPIFNTSILCKAWEPWYFRIPGIPYPLVQHRYFECSLANNYTVLTELGCGLTKDDVQYANLILITPQNQFYRVVINCANFVNDK